MDTIYNVPTGKIITTPGDKGMLEVLSIGDYGQTANIKADFLGLSEPIHGVRCTEIMPLERKWVMTLSTQHGCSMKCGFCDVPSVGKGLNVSVRDLRHQITTARNVYPDVVRTDRLNIHFARMGEPTFNRAVFDFTEELKDHVISLGLVCDTVHPVLTTMLPKMNRHLEMRLLRWCEDIKNGIYNGEAGLQLSINSTSDKQREDMFGGCSHYLGTIAEIADKLPMPKGRKYALNFALADDYEVDGHELLMYFDPEKFMVKITPIHITTATEANGIMTTGGYDAYTPYQDAEDSCIAAGFDTLVFIPSRDEDDGMITCGNAVLTGRLPVINGLVIPGEAT